MVSTHCCLSNMLPFMSLCSLSCARNVVFLWCTGCRRIGEGANWPASVNWTARRERVLVSVHVSRNKYNFGLIILLWALRYPASQNSGSVVSTLFDSEFL